MLRTPTGFCDLVVSFTSTLATSRLEQDPALSILLICSVALLMILNNDEQQVNVLLAIIIPLYQQGIVIWRILFFTSTLFSFTRYSWGFLQLQLLEFLLSVVKPCWCDLTLTEVKVDITSAIVMHTNRVLWSCGFFCLSPDNFKTRAGPSSKHSSCL